MKKQVKRKNQYKNKLNKKIKISQIWNFALKVHNNLNFWQKSNIRIFEMKFCFQNVEVNGCLTNVTCHKN